MEGVEAGQRISRGAIGVLANEVARGDPVGDHPTEKGSEAIEDARSDPVVDRSILRAVKDLDELELVWLTSDSVQGPAQCPNAVRRGRRRDEHSLDAVGDAAHKRLRHRVDDVVLGAEVEVEGPFGSPGTPDDVVDRRRFDALLDEYSDRRVDQRLLALDAASFGAGGDYVVVLLTDGQSL
jgi:hypothetical protein